MLHIANHSICKLAKQYGTPLYIFDRATIINACKQYQQAFEMYYHASDVQMLYASKAYISPLVTQLIAEQGFGLDVVSGGELAVAQRAKFPMERISFHGNNKSEAELRVALRLGIGRIILDNWSELERVARLAQELQIRPAVLLRVAPEVETDTHRYLQTGHASSKFGFALAEAKQQVSIFCMKRHCVLSGYMHTQERCYARCDHIKNAWHVCCGLQMIYRAKQAGGPKR